MAAPAPSAGGLRERHREQVISVSRRHGPASRAEIGALTSLSFAMYFDAIRLPVDQFRATMSAALVAMGLVRGLGYFGLGEFSGDCFRGRVHVPIGADLKETLA